MATLKVSLEEVLVLNPTDHIADIGDIVTDADKQVLLNVRNQLRNLTEDLDQLRQPELNLFDRDFYQLFVQFVAAARREFIDDNGDPRWTDFRPTNIGTFFLQLMATSLDRHYYLSDRMVAQQNISSVTEMRYFYQHARGMAFQPLLRDASLVLLEITLPLSYSSPVTMLAGTKVATTDGTLVFETTVDLVFSAGTTIGSVEARHWNTTVQNHFFAGVVDDIVVLDSVQVLDGLHAVTINGQQWTRVTNFFDSASTDRHFVVRFLENEGAQYEFGDGVNGAVPNGPGTLTYRQGGGSVGNGVQRGRVTKLLSTVLHLSQPIVGIIVSNSTTSSGGRDRPSLDRQVAELVKSLKQLTRTVTLEDYEDNIESVSGVARCLALDRTEDVTIERGKIVTFIVPEQGTTFDAALVARITDFLTDPIDGRPMPHDKILEVIETNYQDIEVAGTIQLLRGFDPAILASIQAQIVQYFNPLNRDRNFRFTTSWGHKKPEVPLSVLTELVMRYQSRGVVKVDFTLPTGNVTIDDRLFPRLTTVNNLLIEVVDDNG